MSELVVYNGRRGSLELWRHQKNRVARDRCGRSPGRTQEHPIHIGGNRRSVDRNVVHSICDPIESAVLNVPQQISDSVLPRSWWLNAHLRIAGVSFAVERMERSDGSNCGSVVLTHLRNLPGTPRKTFAPLFDRERCEPRGPNSSRCPRCTCRPCRESFRHPR